MPHIERAEDFYSLSLTDCVAIGAQYRPAIQDYTLKFPSGMVDADDTPEMYCVKEIQEGDRQVLFLVI